MEKNKILQRWTEYISDLFADDRGNKPEIWKSMEGPEILTSEVRAALQKLKKNKAAGPDDIVTEMIVALEDFGIEKLTEILNEVYDSGEIPEDLSKSIFIALPKKPGAIDCEMHRTISLMSHVIKILLRILIDESKKEDKTGDRKRTVWVRSGCWCKECDLHTENAIRKSYWDAERFIRLLCRLHKSFRQSAIMKNFSTC